ncbi:MAG TPA: glycoside hydrolase family 99-like domain-containing protein [Candidatus Udaeobacter sp.]|jgi:hypothetical protein|nr:glycoside hydrolase family 99-like domain-containing protein [Candidatus Udaeobacter sp.]
MNRKVRLIAFYLPQFHPIPENDLWWGTGFTEWTNVAKAKPLFRQHYQPRLPADLGYYDLRIPEVRAAQARLAHNAGIEGFCYWHYWFAGRRLLERPFNEVLKTGQPDFPFCLGWANESWSGIWHGAPNRILLEQTYPGPQDHEKHFYALLEAFQDARYIRVYNKPLFVIYRPSEVPECGAFIEQWQTLASRNGLDGIYFVAHTTPRSPAEDYKKNGFSGVLSAAALKVSSMNIRGLMKRRWENLRRPNPNQVSTKTIPTLTRIAHYTMRKVMEKLGADTRRIYDYEDAMLFFLDGARQNPDWYPCVVPGWDNSPRSGKRGYILRNSTPELFRQHLREALKLVEARDAEDRIVFVKSWNEWAEGNYLEPDQRFGHQYLDVLREETMAHAGTQSHETSSSTIGHTEGQLVNKR